MIELIVVLVVLALLLLPVLAGYDSRVRRDSCRPDREAPWW
jgi:Tfp pilus assembly protein PilE